MQSKKISNAQELIQSDQGTGILKSDCKQPLRIGIIRALNEWEKPLRIGIIRALNEWEKPLRIGIIRALNEWEKPLRIGIIRALNECMGRKNCIALVNPHWKPLEGIF